MNDIHEGKWHGLVGKFEAGETPEEGVRREILKESRLVILNPQLRGLLVFTNFKGNDWYVFVFTATEFTGALIDSLEGEFEWIADEKVTGFNLRKSDHMFFPWIQDGKFFFGKV
jgi:8-oxo-dGTP diphosphatase